MGNNNSTTATAFIHEHSICYHLLFLRLPPVIYIFLDISFRSSRNEVLYPIATIAGANRQPKLFWTSICQLCSNKLSQQHCHYNYNTLLLCGFRRQAIVVGWKWIHRNSLLPFTWRALSSPIDGVIIEIIKWLIPVIYYWQMLPQTPFKDKQKQWFLPSVQT